MRGIRKERVLLQKILKYCNNIAQLLEECHTERDEFAENLTLQLACGMCIIQIGELVSRLGREFEQEHSEIPWRQIKGMRNMFAHDYEEVDSDVVWSTITQSVPELKKEVSAILPTL